MPWLWEEPAEFKTDVISINGYYIAVLEKLCCLCKEWSGNNGSLRPAWKVFREPAKRESIQTNWTQFIQSMTRRVVFKYTWKRHVHHSYLFFLSLVSFTLHSLLHTCPLSLCLCLPFPPTCFLPLSCFVRSVHDSLLLPSSSRSQVTAGWENQLYWTHCSSPRWAGGVQGGPVTRRSPRLWRSSQCLTVSIWREKLLSGWTDIFI